MPRKQSPATLAVANEIETRIHIIRGQRGMLDFQLAELYGVMTAALSQAVVRTLARFPDNTSFRSPAARAGHRPLTAAAVTSAATAASHRPATPTQRRFRRRAA